MIDDKELQILRCLRTNARISLTEISKRTGIPTSTVFERLKKVQSLVLKHTSLVDFTRMGYPVRLLFLVEIKNIEAIAGLSEMNSIRRLSTKDLFFLECVFKSQVQAYDFIEELGDKSVSLRTFTVIEDIVRERFLSSYPGKDTTAF